MERALTGSGSAMAAALVASDPAPGLPPGAVKSGRFVGGWGCLITFHHANGQADWTAGDLAASGPGPG